VTYLNPYTGKQMPAHLDADGYLIGNGDCPEFANSQSKVNEDDLEPEDEPEDDPQPEPEPVPKSNLSDMSLAKVENENKRPCPARCGEYKCPISGCDCWSGPIIVLGDLIDVICVPCVLKEITGQLDRINEEMDDDNV
jgi:hypothetical protein